MRRKLGTAHEILRFGCYDYFQDWPILVNRGFNSALSAYDQRNDDKGPTIIENLEEWCQKFKDLKEVRIIICLGPNCNIDKFYEWKTNKKRNYSPKFQKKA